jgi:putative transposase
MHSSESNRKIKIQAELKRLRNELAKVKLEKTILEKCADYLQAGTKVKFEFINQNVSCFPVKDMCRILDVSTNGHYKWKNRTLYKRDQFQSDLD